MNWLILFLILAVIISFIIAIIIIDLQKDHTTNQTPIDIPSISKSHLKEKAGIIGEKRVYYYLKQLLENDEVILQNLLIPASDGQKTEVDLLIFSYKGIFCIEVKNWTGKIEGDDESDYWLQIYNRPHSANKFLKSPVKQNNYHCVAIEKLIYTHFLDNLAVTNIIIFPELNAKSEINSIHTFDLLSFSNYYRSLPSDKFLSEEIQELSDFFKRYEATKEQRKEHAELIKNRYNHH